MMLTRLRQTTRTSVLVAVSLMSLLGDRAAHAQSDQARGETQTKILKISSAKTAWTPPPLKEEKPQRADGAAPHSVQLARSTEASGNTAPRDAMAPIVEETIASYYAQLQQENRTLQEGYDASQQTLTHLKQTNAALLQTLADLRQSQTDLRAQLTTLTETNKRLEAMIREAKRGAQAAEDTAQLKRQADELRETLRQERANLHRELGLAYMKAQLFDQAISAYNRSLEFEPDDAQAHYYLGLLYQHARNNDELSASHFQKYLALSPTLTPKKRKEIEYLIQMLQSGAQ